jgi:cytochrome c-type biogenesis protein CcmE
VTADRPDDGPLAEDGLDLTPRQPAPRARKQRRRWGPIIALVLAIAAGAVFVTQFLSNALDYYCNADEVGVKKECSGNRSMRVQGTVEKGSLLKQGTETHFIIAFNGKAVPVVYDGDPGGKFEECIPVVVRGRIQGGVLQGNQVEVKHSNEYTAKNPGRVEAAGSDCPVAA